jgi:hypothetical protein
MQHLTVIAACTAWAQRHGQSSPLPLPRVKTFGQADSALPLHANEQQGTRNSKRAATAAHLRNARGTMGMEDVKSGAFVLRFLEVCNAA